MIRLVLIIFSCLLVVSGVWGITDPVSSVEWMLATNPELNLLRFGMAAGLLLSALPFNASFKFARLFLKSFGALFLILTMVWLFAPNYVGVNSYSILPADLLLALLGSIICLHTALEIEQVDKTTFAYNVPIKDIQLTTAEETMFDQEEKTPPVYAGNARTNTA